LEIQEAADLKIHNMARTVSKFSSFLIAVLAALVPVFSMVALYFIKRTIIRLWTLIGLTMAFALAVKFCTSAKSTDVFAVTVAYVSLSFFHWASTEYRPDSLLLRPSSSEVPESRERKGRLYDRDADLGGCHCAAYYHKRPVSFDNLF
jgi:hypothetical protein